MRSIRGFAPAAATVRLTRPDGSEPVTRPDGSESGVEVTADSAGRFELSNLQPGWYLLIVSKFGFLELAKGVRVGEDTNLDLGRIDLLLALIPEQPSVPIVTVCEALEQRYSLNYRRIVIVGIFKSGMDETLRLDCPEQLVSDDVGWPSAIGLTRPSPPPEALRGEIEKKRQEVIKNSPPEAPLRPERVVGLYGIFVSVAGLTSAACCKAQVETVLPPARLFGLGETDRRVIR